MEILAYMWKAYILEWFQPTQSIIKATTLEKEIPIPILKNVNIFFQNIQLRQCLKNISNICTYYTCLDIKKIQICVQSQRIYLFIYFLGQNYAN